MGTVTGPNMAVNETAPERAPRQQLRHFRRGLKQGLPVAFGYFPSALAFGVMALTVGLSAQQAVLTSALVFAGAGQFMAVNLLSGGAPPLAIIAANLVVNLRYFVMSASFSRRLKISRLEAALVGFGVTDETFLVNYLTGRAVLPSEGRTASDEDSAGEEPAYLPTSYVLGVNTIAYAGWVLGTWAGAVFADVLPESFSAGMGIILYAMFIALLIPAAAEHWTVGGIAAAGGGLCWVFSQRLSAGWAVVLATMLAAALGVMLLGKGVEEL